MPSRPSIVVFSSDYLTRAGKSPMSDPGKEVLSSVCQVPELSELAQRIYWSDSFLVA